MRTEEERRASRLRITSSRACMCIHQIRRLGKGSGTGSCECRAEGRKRPVELIFVCTTFARTVLFRPSRAVAPGKLAWCVQAVCGVTSFERCDHAPYTTTSS